MHIATPPGATIKEQLIDRDMSQKEFSIRMNLSEKHISKLINGDVQLTYDVAMRLENVLGVPASFWNNLEAIYREKLIKIEQEKSVSEDEYIAKLMPYAEMAEFGWIPKTRDMTTRVLNLRKYFEVVRLDLLNSDAIINIVHEPFSSNDKKFFAMYAWTQEAKIQARDYQVESLNVNYMVENIGDIKTMMNRKPNIERLREYFAKFGIAFISLPGFKESSSYSMTFLDGKKMVMCVEESIEASVYWNRVLREVGHIALGHINRPRVITADEEAEVNNWLERFIS